LHGAAAMTEPLRDYARDLLRAEGFAVDAPPEVERELAVAAARPARSPENGADVVDLTHLPWSSIDNVETRDVDQLEHSEERADGTVVRVAIADVDAYVHKGSALDAHAAQNTVSVYGGEVVLPMLPTSLSEGLTSLLTGEDRLAIVAEFVVDASGMTRDGRIYRALVRNTAQLDYASISTWLAGSAPLPSNAVGLEDQLRMQNAAAIRLRAQRVKRGALEFERRETRPVVRSGAVVDIVLTRRGAARDLIEDFMIAANAVIAEYLEAHNVSWIRRMVGAPERWPAIVAVAAQSGVTLPAEPDRVALGAFLNAAHARSPDTYAEISLSVLRLLGSGSYVVEHRAEELGAHFALGVDDYTHFTAPNRRYADVITQRIVKAVLAHAACPYGDAELDAIAAQCTRMEDKAHAVERKVARHAAVLVMRDRVGEVFEGVVTFVDRGRVSVVLDAPAVEARVTGDVGSAVGDRVRVRVTAVDVEKDHIDLEPAP
jgi:exoribonuclease-2